MLEIRKKRGRRELAAEPLTKREEAAARALDDTLRRYAAMETQISLMIGRGLNLLEAIDGFSKLAYATRGQYAKEVLGLMPGYASQRARMETLLRERPHLRHLLVTAQTSFSVMRRLLAHTTPVGEEVWAELVKGRSVEHVKQLLASFELRVQRQQDARCADEASGGGEGDAHDDDGGIEGDGHTQGADGGCEDDPYAQADGGHGDEARPMEGAGPVHDDVWRAPEGGDGDLDPDILRRLAELARRCVAAPRGVAPSKPDPDLDDRPRGRWVEFGASPLLVAKYDTSLEITRRETESQLTDGECIELISADFLAGAGGVALTVAHAWDIGETSPDGACAAAHPNEGRAEVPSERHDAASSGSACVEASTDDTCPEIGAARPSGAADHARTLDDADPASSRHAAERDLDPRVADLRRRAAQQREWTAFWREARRDLDDFNHHWDALSWAPLEVPSQDELSPTHEMTCQELNDRLVHLVAISRRCRVHLRRLLTAFADARTYRKLGFSDLEHYVDVRLPMSYDDARLLIRLERGLFGLDLIRQAHDENRLTQSRALLLIGIATPEFESDWLQHALYTTVVHLTDDVKRADRLKTRDPEFFAATGGVPALWRSVLQARRRERTERDAQGENGTRTRDGRGENGTDPCTHDAQGENGTHRCTHDGQGENGTGSCTHDAHGENGTHRCTHDAQGENGTGSCTHDAQGENGTHRCTHDAQGENGTGSCTHDAQGENGTSSRARPPHRRNPRAKGACPAPTFQETLRLVLAGVVCELDEDVLTGVTRRLRFWLPEEMELPFRNACRAAILMLGGHGGLTYIMELILDYFLEQYGRRALDQIRKHPIIARDEARCAVPTCGRRVNLQVHHIEFRSHGGSDASVNKITLCAAHHLKILHDGRMRVYGTSPNALVWDLGILPDGTVNFRVVDRTIVPGVSKAA